MELVMTKVGEARDPVAMMCNFRVQCQCMLLQACYETSFFFVMVLVSVVWQRRIYHHHLGVMDHFLFSVVGCCRLAWVTGFTNRRIFFLNWTIHWFNFEELRDDGIIGSGLICIPSKNLYRYIALEIWLVQNGSMIQLNQCNFLIRNRMVMAQAYQHITLTSKFHDKLNSSCITIPTYYITPLDGQKPHSSVNVLCKAFTAWFVPCNR